MTLLVAGALVWATVSNEQARRDAIAAEAAAQQERETAKQEAEARARAIDDGEVQLTEGEAAFLASESWGEPNRRQALRESLDALAAELSDARDGQPASPQIAEQAVKDAMAALGTEAEAKDRQYLELASMLEGYEITDADPGHRYCENLQKHYSSTDIRSVMFYVFGDRSQFLQLDEAAVRVFCPEFVPPMEIALSGFHDGHHVVGETIEPGVYRTYGGVADCYYERNNGRGEIIENNFTTAHSGVTVTLGAGEGFTSERCGLWVPAD